MSEIQNCLTSHRFIAKSEGDEWKWLKCFFLLLLFLKDLCWGMQWLSGKYCTRWSRSARLRVRRKNVLKHPLTQKLLESLQEQIEKATTTFVLQVSIVLILGQLYQIIPLLETHVRGKVCWKAAKGSSSKSKWMNLTYLCRCTSYFVLSFLVSSYLILSTLLFPFFTLKKKKKEQQTNKKHL